MMVESLLPSSSSLTEGNRMQGLVSFEEVAVYFTLGEWALLDPGQIAMYREVMLENYRMAMSVGRRGSTPILVSWLKEEGLFLQSSTAVAQSEGILGSGDVKKAITGETPQSSCVSKGELALPLRGMRETFPFPTKDGGESDVWGSKIKVEFSGVTSEGATGSEALGSEDGEKMQGGEPIPKEEDSSRAFQGGETEIQVHTHDVKKRRESETCRSGLSCHGVILGEQHYTCQSCAKSFSRHSHLARHRKIHSGERPYLCSECGKSFRRPGALASHQAIHTGEKRYQCSECGKRFRRSDSLSLHHRIHTGEGLHGCSVCGKSFLWKSTFIDHLRIHTGDKPFRCSECGKSFRQRSHLGSHRAVHTGEKPHRCSECGKSFTRRHSLCQHQRIHAAEGLQNCFICEKSFSRKSWLVKHLKNSHRVEAI